MVNKGLCFSSYSLNQCQSHSSCRDGERCCGTYCCPMSYYSQWRNFTCSSDLQCTTLRTGDACCKDQKCCWKEDNQIKEIIEEKVEKHQEEEEKEDLMNHVEPQQVVSLPSISQHLKTEQSAIFLTSKAASISASNFLKFALCVSACSSFKSASSML